jgi:hypothetical protein
MEENVMMNSLGPADAANHFASRLNSTMTQLRRGCNAWSDEAVGYMA